MRAKTAIVLLTLFQAVHAAPALADPVVVRSGSLTVSGVGSFADFVLVGSDGTRIEGRWPGTGVPCAGCPGATAGTQVTPDLRLFYDQVPFPHGDPFATGTVGGTQELIFSGELLFDGESFILPPIPPGPAQGYIFNRPVVFSGTLAGYDRLQERVEIDPVFSTTLTGAGMASLRFHGELVEGVSRYLYVDTRYDFSDPIPEPGTILLTIAGFGAMALRGRKRTTHG